MRYFTTRARTGLTSLLALFLFSGLFLVGCDSGGGTPETQNDLTGTVSGQVVDKVSSAPIEGATVTVAAGSLDDGDTFTAVTGDDGEFRITDVPVTTGTQDESPNGEQDNPSASYGLRVETPDGSQYRDRYRGQVELAFGNTESDNPAENLVANVTFPISETVGTVTGRVLVDTPTKSVALNQGTLALVQEVPVQFDANGNVLSTVTVSKTASTNANGSFTIDGAVVDNGFELYAMVGSQKIPVANAEIPANQSTVTLEESINPAPFEIVNVTPDEGADIAADTTITFSFNRPVAQNGFTQAGAPESGLDDSDGQDDYLANELYITRGNAKSAKSLSPDDTYPVEISYSNNRTELSISPVNPLPDGYNYTLVTGSASPSSNGTAFSDARFRDAYGLPLSDEEPQYNFSVADDLSKPAAPSVSFEDQGDPGDETINEDGNLNYTDQTVTAELRIDDPDGATTDIKGYEVYYRAQDQTGRRGNGDQFVKVDAVSPNAANLNGINFEDEDGIIPVETLDEDAQNFDDGQLEFTATIGANGTGSSTPFAAADGSYGPIEWRVRAVSVNNVRGAFTTVTTHDNTDPDETGATADESDDEVVITFDEALDVSTATNTANYELDEDGGDPLTVTAIDVENTVAGGSEVTLTVDDPDASGTGFDSSDEPIEVTLDGQIEDLRGNGLDLDADADDDEEITAN